jgi:hypothetical protein
LLLYHDSICQNMGVCLQCERIHSPNNNDRRCFTSDSKFVYNIQADAYISFIIKLLFFQWHYIEKCHVFPPNFLICACSSVEVWEKMYAHVIFNQSISGRRFERARYLVSKLIKILPFLEIFLVLRVLVDNIFTSEGFSRFCYSWISIFSYAYI